MSKMKIAEAISITVADLRTGKQDCPEDGLCRKCLTEAMTRIARLAAMEAVHRASVFSALRGENAAEVVAAVMGDE